ncbi:MAG: 2'-5' RNA ligase family protein [Chloroflexota bacterium]
MDLESSLIVPVPAATDVAEPWRERLDPFSAYGMPAHVTVEYPFLPPASIDDELLVTLREMFAAMPSFRYRLSSVEWFESSVVWLAPEPDERYREMTAAVMRRWPDLRPYGGPPGKVPPHLTLGVSDAHDRLVEAARHVEPSLPIDCLAEEVWLMTGSSAPGSWAIKARFTLAGPGPEPRGAE